MKQLTKILQEIQILGRLANVDLDKINQLSIKYIGKDKPGIIKTGQYMPLIYIGDKNYYVGPISSNSKVLTLWRANEFESPSWPQVKHKPGWLDDRKELIKILLKQNKVKYIP